jgi:hypothetical protein
MRGRIRRIRLKSRQIAARLQVKPRAGSSRFTLQLQLASAFAQA